MKKFNKAIKIEVQVDVIANKLLDTFDKENTHREMITETIIESMMKSDHIGLLYNNLLGWTNELNFTKGQVVKCSATAYQYKLKNEVALEVSINAKPQYESGNFEIGDAIIEQVDIYRASGDLVEIKFMKVGEDGRLSPVTKWVSPSTLTERGE